MNTPAILALLPREHKAAGEIAALIPTTQIPEVHRELRIYLKKKASILARVLEGEPESVVDAMMEQAVADLVESLELLKEPLDPVVSE